MQWFIELRKAIELRESELRGEAVDFVGEAERLKRFGKRFIELLRKAIELRESELRGEAVDFVGEAERLKREVSHHLRDRHMPDPDNQRLRRERMALDFNS